jgi:DNA recombination protein RmuC
MEIYFLGLSIVGAVFIATTIFLYFKWQQCLIESRNAIISNQELPALRERLEQYMVTTTAQEVKIETLEEENHKLSKQINNLLTTCENLKEEKYNLEKEIDLREERVIQIKKSMEDWQKVREESIQNAKAAIFEAGNQLSNKLLEEHKKETENLKKESQETIDNTTTKLHEQFNQVVNSVAALNSQVQESKDTVELVKRALLSPGGAGSLAEITLENILKSSGLTEGRDFIMQYSITDDGEGNKLRPDAVVFLPGNNILVIDSKASKFFLEIAAAENVEEEKALLDKLKLTMRNHLKALAAKDYKQAILNHLKRINPEMQINFISAIIFLPSEMALEKLAEADGEFMEKSWECNIFPAGPIGVMNILANSKFQIAESKRIENHQMIIDEVRKLLSSLSTIYEHIRKVGSGLQSAVTNYDKLAGSFNSNLLPKAKNIEKLGVHLQQNKNLPNHLERYQVISTTNMTLIEGDTESDSDNSEKPELLRAIG